MKKSSYFIMPLVTLLFFVIGCQNSKNPVEIQTSNQSKINTLAKKGPVLQSVTGSGNFTTAAGDFRTFSFTARLYANGSVDGQWERIRRAAGNASQSKSHGEVTCFTISGTQAWIGGFATSGLFSTPPNNEVGWRVADKGQGNNAPPDQISLQFVGGALGFAANYCATTQNNPGLNNVQAGNIQVRP